MGGYLAWWIVPTFYVVAVIATFQVLTAFTVELFLSLKEEAEAADEEEEEEEEEEKEKVSAPLQEAILQRMQSRLVEKNLQLHSKVWIEPSFQRRLTRLYAKECAKCGDSPKPETV